jgi:hypothetical protein
MLSQLRKGSTQALIKEATRSAVSQCFAAARTAPFTLRQLSTTSARRQLGAQTPRSTPLTAGKERGTPLVPTELLQVLEETIKASCALPSFHLLELTSFGSCTDSRTAARLPVHDPVSSASYARLLHHSQGLWIVRRLHHQPRDLSDLWRGAQSAVPGLGQFADSPLIPIAACHLVCHAVGRPRRFAAREDCRARSWSRNPSLRHLACESDVSLCTHEVKFDLSRAHRPSSPCQSIPRRPSLPSISSRTRRRCVRSKRRSCRLVGSETSL